MISAYPAAFAGSWLSNVGLGLVQIATAQGSDWVLALVFWAVPALAIFSKTRRAAPQDISQDLGTCAAIGVAFLGLASMALVFPEALLPVSAILGAVTIVFSLKALPATRVLLAILLVPNLLLSYQTGREYVAREGTDGGQLVAFEETSNTLQTLGATSASRITSVHPARALKAGTRWLAAPAAGYSEFCGFLAYDYGSRIDAYVPRIPVSDTLAPPNFVVVDPFLRGLLSRNDVTLKDRGTCPNLHLSSSTTPVTPEVDIIVLQPER